MTPTVLDTQGANWPDEWTDVLVFHQRAWKRGHWFEHADSAIRWQIEGRFETSPSHWQPMPLSPTS